ncbi:hypothetical protein JWG41_02940 [Leptospira sp. 201903075]|uniref:hypothetical protein n=1 Tax=Leptospira chreensis TaxID=2810035 RepID=UPI001965DE1E|nr:hypothetical protein [Leptospira chreensis]MBM9589386.1 hypothetical protein [Leptospira chreensis]
MKLEELRVRKLVIAGNGSVYNGWDPIKNIFNRKELVTGSGRINLKQYVAENKTLEALILITHLKRVFRSKLINDKIKGKDYSSSIEIIKNLNEYNTFFAEEFSKLINLNIIKFTPEIDFIYSLIQSKIDYLDTLFLTLNWDNLAWNDQTLGNVGYLHGSILHPETMFMPSQYLSENFEFNAFSSIDETFFSPQEKELLLKGDKDIYLESITQVFNNCFGSCEELYLWGVGLNIYDTDLMSTLSVVHPEKLRKIIIINKATEKENLLSRIRVMIPNFKATIGYINTV